jgi:hypothetical protein
MFGPGILEIPDRGKLHSQSAERSSNLYRCMLLKVNGLCNEKLGKNPEKLLWLH